ncbi:GNAT family N-acetyltransferase [Candidatus Micrarchaeota archaeon]|nr:GNAT family N-acetyltransferase [Candidatus Micrarchaeota archaeon]
MDDEADPHARGVKFVPIQFRVTADGVVPTEFRALPILEAAGYLSIDPLQTDASPTHPVASCPVPADALLVDIVAFEPSKHLDDVVRFCARTANAPQSLFRRELLKLYHRLPTGFFVALAKDTGRPVGFISMGFLKPKPLRFLMGILGSLLPAAVEPLVRGLVALRVVSTFEVANVIVDLDYQRQGIGGQLIGLGERFIASRFTQSRVSLYVREDNVSALRLYRKLGFKTLDAFLLGGRKKLVLSKAISTSPI